MGAKGLPRRPVGSLGAPFESHLVLSGLQRRPIGVVSYLLVVCALASTPTGVRVLHALSDIKHLSVMFVSHVSGSQERLCAAQAHKLWKRCSNGDQGWDL